MRFLGRWKLAYMEKQLQVQNWFAYIGAVLLFVIGIPLLVAARDNFDILALSVTDSFLPLTNRQILYSAGGYELALSAFLLFASNPKARLLVTAWLMVYLIIFQGLEFFWSQHNSMGCLI